MGVNSLRLSAPSFLQRSRSRADGPLKCVRCEGSKTEFFPSTEAPPGVCVRVYFCVGGRVCVCGRVWTCVRPCVGVCVHYFAVFEYTCCLHERSRSRIDPPKHVRVWLVENASLNRGPAGVCACVCALCVCVRGGWVLETPFLHSDKQS